MEHGHILERGGAVLNRRSFITVLGAAMAGLSASPLIHVPELPDRQRWRRREGSLIIVPNPEWVEAPYGIEFGTIHQGLGVFYVSLTEEAKRIRQMLPYRYRMEEDGRMVLIEPFLVRRSS